MAKTISQTKAAALFKKEERAREGAKAMAEYEAQAEAIRERTARLRALRLAQPPIAPVKKPRLMK